MGTHVIVCLNCECHLLSAAGGSSWHRSSYDSLIGVVPSGQVAFLLSGIRTEVKAIVKYDDVILQPGHEGAQWMSVFKRMIASLHTCHAQLMVIGS